MNRSPHDGEPYYCIVCGLGWGEYVACEDVTCQLEPESSAKARMRIAKKPPKTKQVKDLLAGDRVIMEDKSIRTVETVEFGYAKTMRGQHTARGALIRWAEGEYTIASRIFECFIAEDQ